MTAKGAEAVELTPLQWLYLEAAFDEDQAKEAQVRANGGAGHYERRPAKEWRLMRVSHGTTEGHGAVRRDVTKRAAEELDLPARKVWNSGNGIRWAALADRGLIERDWDHDPFYKSPILMVRFTRKGRKVIRARRAEGAA